MSRRAAIREAGHNGVDEVEVSDDGRQLTVTFLGRAPDGLTPGNVRIDGGRRVTGIVAVEVSVEHADDPELDDRLLVTVDRPGDTSRYRLSIVESGGHEPYHGFDQRYYRTGFRFWPDRPAAFDPDRAAPEKPGEPAPVIDYTARDYDTVRRLILDRLALTVPGWIERNPADLGVTLVELLAYTADQISYQQDAVATEAYLDTARHRVSVRRHVKLIDYPMHDGGNARAIVVAEVAEPVTLEPGSYRFAAQDEIFEPLDRRPVKLRPEHNAIRFWTWAGDERTRPPGATGVTLRDDDRCLRLHPGDVLVLEENDPKHRQAVRLTTVTPDVDRLTDQPVLEVTWAAEDALTFRLDLANGVARGNAIVVDHGRTEETGDEPLHDVTQAAPYPSPEQICAAQAAHLAALPHREDLTRRLDVLIARAQAGTVLGDHIAEEIAQTWGREYAIGLHPTDPALAGPIAKLAGDPRQALPAVEVRHAGQTWVPHRDLLSSGPRDRHFVGELTNDGRLTLRFTKEIPGRKAIRYRTGGGTAGNVGAEAICVLLRNDEDQTLVRVRNPLPAVGGTDPEPIDQARRLAPLDLKRRKARAITAADYAELASALPGVQRAAAEIRWTGSGAEAHVAVDARGTGIPSPQLLAEVAHRLEAYRRIGHDLIVEPARPIPLDIVLDVHAAPGHQQGRIAAQLHHRLIAAFRPDALTFGDPVRVSRLTALAASVPGVRSARVTRLRRLFAPDAGELAAGLLRLGPLEVARCDNDPDRPENGRLVIDLTDGGE
ncbi:putative baseplate assembly protein [Paractinoplanes durhamensis]|uniref:Baseplate assembly protein n=1 Tax=Paractinoplanes durhamensis TaxID=113563 RepID=A0ABQ3YV83_9ACTN|nr:putative baseplate assembly protein [Actinoplanes durhamensis]GIE01446.1 putative baseplate assembly protein [Actinoplanes durhamensis]